MVRTMARTSEQRVHLALAVLLALGSWPWLSGLGLWPMAPDSGLWIERGAPIDPEWTSWVFGTRHFHVGYRPVTALTYTLDYLVAGLDPFVYRATDLALHLAAAVGVFAVFRRVFRAASPWAALVAAALFLAHPAVEEAVPYIARRSYALSTAFALAGLATWLGPVGRTSGPSLVRASSAGVLLALGLLSNEVAVLPIAVLPLLAWASMRDEGPSVAKLAQRLLVPGLLVVAALAVRLWVVGGIGGYRTEEDEATSRLLPVAAAVWRAAAGLPTPVDSQDTPIAWVLQWVLLIGALPYYAWLCATGSLERRVLGLWILATAVLFALQEVWFPRQGYTLAAPVAMLVAHALWGTWCANASTGARTALGPRLLASMPQALLIGTLLASSAMVVGPDARRTREWAWRDALIDDLLVELEQLDEPADVHTVLPFRRAADPDLTLKGDAARKLLPRGARQPVTWVKLLLRERDLRVQEFAYVVRPDITELEELAPPTLDLATDPPTLRIPDREVILRRGARWIPLESGAPHALPFQPAPRPQPCAVYAYLGGVDGGELVRVPK